MFVFNILAVISNLYVVTVNCNCWRVCLFPPLFIFSSRTPKYPGSYPTLEITDLRCQICLVHWTMVRRWLRETVKVWPVLLHLAFILYSHQEKHWMIWMTNTCTGKEWSCLSNAEFTTEYSFASNFPTRFCAATFKYKEEHLYVYLWSLSNVDTQCSSVAHVTTFPY